MKTLYTAIGFLEGAADDFKPQKITEEVESFIEKLLKHTVKNRKTGLYHFKNEDTGAAERIRAFAEAVCRDEDDPSGEDIVEITREIAGFLTEAEKAAGKRIAAMGGSVKNGSLIFAAVRDDAGQILVILAKVDHSRWFNGKDLTLQSGFPYDDKDIWKTALIRISEERGLAFGDISVYMDRPAAYWTSGFLGLVKVRTDKDNTSIACQRITKTISNRLEGMEALTLWNAFIRKMKTTSVMNYPEFVDELVGDEASVKPGLKKLREELLVLPDKFGFDTQFSIMADAIPEVQLKRILPVNEHMDLILRQGSYDPAGYIKAKESSSGERYLIIRCTDEKTYRSFVRKE